MTILHDLYRNPNAKRRRVGRSGETLTQQGCVDDSTLLTLAEPHRPNSRDARSGMESLAAETAFYADWLDMVFIHFEVDPDGLQKAVPFTLDTYRGKAYVSLVAFTMNRMRLAFGGRVTEWITRPIASHQFLNLRTYVNHRGQTGIFFMKEWLNERLAVLLGPATFGLPYHYATVDYQNGANRFAGRVVGEKGEIVYEGDKTDQIEPAVPGTRDAFFLERYTAFTNAGRRPKFFRVWHRPWQAGVIEAFQLKRRTLLDNLSEPWAETAELAGAHWSPGVRDVWMGRPHAVN